MRVALLQLGEDFLSSFVFLGIYLATGNLPLAVGFALAIGIGQLALAKWRRRRLETMQWLSLALVITLGAATLITNDSRFMTAKPSLIHFAIGAVMLRPGWLDRYMPPIVKEHLPKGVLKLAGFAWAGLMFLQSLRCRELQPNRLGLFPCFRRNRRQGRRVPYPVFRVSLSNRSRHSSTGDGNNHPAG